MRNEDIEGKRKRGRPQNKNKRQKERRCIVSMRGSWRKGDKEKSKTSRKKRDVKIK